MQLSSKLPAAEGRIRIKHYCRHLLWHYLTTSWTYLQSLEQPEISSPSSFLLLPGHSCKIPPTRTLTADTAAARLCQQREQHQDAAEDLGGLICTHLHSLNSSLLCTRVPFPSKDQTDLDWCTEGQTGLAGAWLPSLLLLTSKRSP